MHDDIHRFHQSGNVSTKAKEIDPSMDIRFLGSRLQRCSVGFLSEKGVTNDHNLGIRNGTQSVEQDVLAFPGRQSAENADQGFSSVLELLSESRDGARINMIERQRTDTIVNDSHFRFEPPCRYK